MDEKYTEKLFGLVLLGLVAKSQLAVFTAAELARNQQGGVVISRVKDEDVTDKLLDFAGKYVVNITGTTSVLPMAVVPNSLS